MTTKRSQRSGRASTTGKPPRVFCLLSKCEECFKNDVRAGWRFIRSATSNSFQSTTGTAQNDSEQRSHRSEQESAPRAQASGLVCTGSLVLAFLKYPPPKRFKCGACQVSAANCFSREDTNRKRCCQCVWFLSYANIFAEITNITALRHETFTHVKTVPGVQNKTKRHFSHDDRNRI